MKKSKLERKIKKLEKKADRLSTKLGEVFAKNAELKKKLTLKDRPIVEGFQKATTNKTAAVAQGFDITKCEHKNVNYYKCEKYCIDCGKVLN